MTSISARPFGNSHSGQSVELFTFRNDRGFELSITNLGGRVVSVMAPDRNGTVEDVVLGFDSIDGYLAKNPYFGALVGRYANRIAHAQFTLDDHTYELVRNDGENSLHGGIHEFDGAVWQPNVLTGEYGDCLQLSYTSPDGKGGYPGTLQTQVTYALTDSNELNILFAATTDKPTVLNLTNHSYFDLSGKQGQEGILDHLVTIHADRFTPINQHLVPTGELAPIAGTPFDFRQPYPIGERVDAKNEQLKLALGYDHNFVLNGELGTLRLAARALHPGTGRVLEVLTTQPGIQFYSGNHLDGTVTGKGGAVYRFRTGFCLETQHFPDSPHEPNFPSTRLDPGQQFQAETVFRFGVQS